MSDESKEGPDDPSIIKIQGFDGETKCWRKISARLKEFWKRYPPEDGYGLRSETKDLLSTRPAMAACYEQLIKDGKDPEQFGLPKIGDTGNLVLFRAYLTLKGAVVAEATTLRRVSKTITRDWEKGETAAVNRLLAKLGFAGEVLDLDEIENIQEATQTGGTDQKPPPAQGAGKQKPKTRSSTKSGADAEKTAAAQKRKLEAMNRQIANMEENKGLELSEPAKTVAEASARIRALGAM